MSCFFHTLPWPSLFPSLLLSFFSLFFFSTSISPSCHDSSSSSPSKRNQPCFSSFARRLLIAQRQLVLPTLLYLSSFPRSGFFSSLWPSLLLLSLAISSYIAATCIITILFASYQFPSSSPSSSISQLDHLPLLSSPLHNRQTRRLHGARTCRRLARPPPTLAFPPRPTLSPMPSSVPFLLPR